MSDDKRRFHIQASAREVFETFLSDAMTYLRPDGGSRKLNIEVEVIAHDTGYGYETSVRMVEEIGLGKTTVLNSTFRDR
jgi:hypothetical protein